MNTAVNNIAGCKNYVNSKYKKCKNNNRNRRENINCAVGELQRLQNSEQISVSTTQQKTPLHQRTHSVQHTDKRDRKHSNVPHHQHCHHYHHHHQQQCHQQQQHQRQLQHQLLHDHQQNCATTKRCVEQAQQQGEQHKQLFPTNAHDKRQQHFNQQHPQHEGQRQQRYTHQLQQQQQQRHLRLWPSLCIATSKSNNINCSSNHTTSTSKFNSTEASLHTPSTAALTTTPLFSSSPTRGCASSATAKVSVAGTVAAVATQGSQRAAYILKTVRSASQAATTYYLWWLFGVCLVLFTNGGRDWRSAELTRTTFMVAATYLEPDELIHELDRPGECSYICIEILTCPTALP